MNEEEFTFYPHCWDCKFYREAKPEFKELESCKNRVWYSRNNKITALRFMSMLEQMQNSELCPFYEDRA